MSPDPEVLPTYWVVLSTTATSSNGACSVSSAAYTLSQSTQATRSTSRATQGRVECGSRRPGRARGRDAAITRNSGEHMNVQDTGMARELGRAGQGVSHVERCAQQVLLLVGRETVARDDPVKAIRLRTAEQGEQFSGRRNRAQRHDMAPARREAGRVPRIDVELHDGSGADIRRVESHLVLGRLQVRKWQCAADLRDGQGHGVAVGIGNRKLQLLHPGRRRAPPPLRLRR